MIMVSDFLSREAAGARAPTGARSRSNRQPDLEFEVAGVQLPRLRHPTAPRTLPVMKSFFPLRRGEGAILVFLIAFAAFAFIPRWRTIEAGGMAVFGWLIAALMLVSPALALVAILRRDRSGGAR